MEQDLIKRVQAITNGGELYYDYNEEIDLARDYSFKICRQYNDLVQHQNEYHYELLAGLFAHLGKNVKIEANFLTEFGFNLSVGDNVTILQDVSLIDCTFVTIGNNVVIGPHCGIYTANHAEDPKLRANHYCYERPIVIEDDVVIGGGSVIAPGVKIGAGSIVQAGSVVVKDLPTNSFCLGDPCQAIRKLRED